MKKVTLLFALAIGTGAFAQAPKYVVLEQFTQASCGPCAQQNPGFDATILTPNPNKVRHIAVHTSWPGTDPMYNYNTTESAAQVSLYGITGVPHVVMQGNAKKGAPSSFTQFDIDNEINKGSPIKVKVVDTDNGSTHTAVVTVSSWGAPPSGTYKLKTVILENPITYSVAPGSNGEKVFPNVYRKMLPNTSGDAITLPTQGNSVSYTYTYTEDAAWVLNNIHLVSYLQETSTKAILNAGSTKDPVVNGSITPPTTAVKAGVNAQQSNFSITTTNFGTANEQFVYSLTATCPNDWTSNFVINSNTYTTSSPCTLTVNAAQTIPVAINVTPGPTPAVGKFVLTMFSTTNNSSMTATVYVIAGITDLVVSNAAGKGDGSAGSALTWEGDFVNGLIAAGCTSYGKTEHNVFVRAVSDGAISAVKNIYYNIGWTFPAFNDNTVAQLTTFLNSGKCMFVSGQDIGWDTWDLTNGGNGTVNTQAFYTNFLGATYVNDGTTTAGVALTTQTSDPEFGTVPNTTLINYYGGTYFFPDEINPTGTGVTIFKYGSTSKVGGVRNTNGTWKTVYLCPGVEQLANTTAKNNMITASYNWFNKSTGTEEFDRAMLGLGQNYPNPSNGLTAIPMSKVETDMTLQVIDLAGRVVMQQKVAKGTELVNINTSGIDAGMYMYRLTDGSTVSKAKPMQVVH